MTPPTTPNLVLRAWREDHGLTRPQMADALNQTPTAEQPRTVGVLHYLMNQ